MRKFLSSAFSLVSALLISLVLSEWILAVFGFPTEIQEDLYYPPHFSKTISWVGHNYKLETNALGLRYPDIPLEKGPHEKRTLVIGDSFVEGVGVEASQTFLALLEQRLSGADTVQRFINAGVSGAGPDEYEKTAECTLPYYRPDRLMVVFYANDVADMPSGGARPVPLKKSGIKRLLYTVFPRIYALIQKNYTRFGRDRTREAIQQAVSDARGAGISQETINRWLKNVAQQNLKVTDRPWEGADRLSTPLLTPRIWHESFELNAPAMRRKWCAAALTLNRLNKRAHANGAAYAVVFAPHPYLYDAQFGPEAQLLGLETEASWRQVQTPLEKALEAYCRQHQIPFLNLTPLFRQAAAEGQTLNFGIDEHWNPEGHRLTADAVAAWLETHS